MDEFLTVAEINSRFNSEWVLVDEPRTDADLAVQSGTVLYHSPNRDDVYRKAIELHPKRFAILFTGTIPEGTEVVL